MPELTIKAIGAQSETTEYGWPMEAADRYQVLVPESLHGNNEHVAKALVRNDPRLIDSANMTVTLTNKLLNGDYRIEVQRVRLNEARRQDNFRLYYRTGVTSEPTAVDANGLPIYSEYDGDIQSTTLDANIPLYEVHCVGIRDLTPMTSPANLSSRWVGGVNEFDFNANQAAGISAGKLFCAGVDCEPHYLNASTGAQVYRIHFRFMGRNDGWRKYVYWRDPQTNMPPPGIAPQYWSRLIQLYRTFDFNQAWPFGDDVG